MGLPAFAANLDARKCFDRICHDGLFYRLVEHLSANCWLLVVSWYRHLAGRVFFGGSISEEFSVVRGTRQGAILSPAFANVFLHPLLAALDDIGCGAYLQQHHVPGVCYADDLFLLSTNARHLSTLLGLVSDFARNWRLDFVHSDSVRTKSHCIVFGGELLAHSPTWMLSGQQLMTRVQTQHLGVMMDSRLTAGADTGRGGRGQPPLLASWHKAPPQRQTCPFLLMSEVLSLLSLLRGALLRTWHATSPCQWHLGILIHTRAPFSTPGRPPPHQGALLHTRAPSSIPGRSPQH